MHADLILKSNNIFTGLTDNTIAGFIAIHSNQIIYVGNHTIENYINSKTKIIDVGEKLIIPGLHDAHMHLLLAAMLNTNKMVNLFATTSENDVLQATQKFQQNFYNAKQTKWLIGLGWAHLNWEPVQLPNIQNLDDLFPDTPVFLLAYDCHTAYTNTKGLQELGITNDSQIDGGEYGKDAKGNLNGILFETAALNNIPKIFNLADEVVAKILGEFIQLLNSYGITGVSDLSIVASKMENDLIPDRIYKQLEDNKQLNLRIHLYPALNKDLTRVLDLQKKYKSSMLRFGGTKQFFDGVTSTHTAYLKQPYKNTQNQDDYGSLLISKDDMHKLLLQAIKHNISTRTHVIGDAAIETFLDIVEDLQQKYPKAKLNYVLEHLEYIDDPDIDRMANLGVMASVQPSHLLSDIEATMQDLGPERCDGMWPLRSFLARGIKLAFGSDGPVDNINPYYQIEAAVKREVCNKKKELLTLQPSEKISVLEALKAYTQGSYQAVNRFSDLGSISVGKLADIVVLEHNILENMDNISNTEVYLTIVDGKIVYAKDS